MSNRKHRLTLGELIRVVSQYARNDHEMNLAVADRRSDQRENACKFVNNLSTIKFTDTGWPRR